LEAAERFHQSVFQHAFAAVGKMRQLYASVNGKSLENGCGVICTKDHQKKKHALRPASSAAGQTLGADADRYKEACRIGSLH
jgi:hypothetical protein